MERRPTEDVHVIAWDVGTTGNKTCLYRIGERIELVAAALEEYPLHLGADGGAEQDGDDWWRAIVTSTRAVLAASRLAPGAVMGLAFCSQMQGSVMVDRKGRALRRAMGYLDGRATEQFARGLQHGPLRISGCNAFKLLNWLRITGGCPATAKDPLWKYLWVKQNEPEIFAATHRWLDVKDYLILRCTGQYGMTPDSANVTFLYDTRQGRLDWHAGLCAATGVNMEHLPPVVASTDRVGGLSAAAAAELGLDPGTPVFGGGGDVSLISLGAGCVDLGDTHIYVGTSGWVSACVGRRMVDVKNFIASILGAIPGRYNYIAEQETSGICLQWVRDHLALDEIGLYLDGRQAGRNGDVSPSLYHLLNECVEETAPGAGGTIFTPWLHGNRSPREDPYARGMFFNIGLHTGKRMLIRAVLEGVAFHKRWMLQAVEKRVGSHQVLRFVGGGALSDVWCQIMADVTGKTIETIEDPQNAGAVGAAAVCAVGLGRLESFQGVKGLIPLRQTFFPRSQYRAVYDRNFQVFETLYRNNRKAFALLNANNANSM